MDLEHLLGIRTDDPGAQRARMLRQELDSMIVELAAVRAENRLSQQAVAKTMGVDPSFVSRIESGRQDLHLSTLKRYAFAVGATLKVGVNNHEKARVNPPPSPWTIKFDDPSRTKAWELMLSGGR